MSVQKNSVNAVIVLGRDILDQELDSVDEVASFSFCWSTFLSGFVVGLNGISGSWFDSGNVEAGSECVS